MDNEIWKDIDINGVKFVVSSEGRLARLLNPYLKKNKKRPDNAYLCVNISTNGKLKSFKVHRLVAQAFIPNPENKPQVNHISGVKTDNRVENLEWVTANENMLHAFKIGLNHSKEKHYKSKLTNAQREEIIKSYIPFSRNFGTRALAKKYNVSHEAISSLIRKYSISSVSENKNID